MSSVCFYFQVHQPWRVKRYRIFDIGNDDQYFNDTSATSLNNQKIFRKVAEKCYLPANQTWLELLRRFPELRLSYSFSGVWLEQAEAFGPDVIQSFRDLLATGQVELLGETYYHSLAVIHSPAEFKRQVKLHTEKLIKLFGVRPTVFRNTELIFNNAVAKLAEELGFRGVIAEGADHILASRPPGLVYQPTGTKTIKLLLKNYKLSDDIAFRFSSQDWSEWPLSVEKYAGWVSAASATNELINLFMDYETFGEHQWADTGIFDFLQALPDELLKNQYLDFVTPSEAIERYPVRGELDAPQFYSWADIERDLSAWLGNEMQRDAARQLYELENKVLHSGQPALVENWRRLSTSDHFYYMCTKWWNDGDVHKYFNPYESPYEAFIAFTNVLNDLKLRLGVSP